MRLAGVQRPIRAIGIGQYANYLQLRARLRLLVLIKRDANALRVDVKSKPAEQWLADRHVGIEGVGGIEQRENAQVILVRIGRIKLQRAAGEKRNRDVGVGREVVLGEGLDIPGARRLALRIIRAAVEHRLKGGLLLGDRR